MGRRHRDLNNFIEETRAKQSNIVFPDTVRNARAVDVFLWRGSAQPTIAQRIGAWIIGLSFIGAGILLFYLVVQLRVQQGFSFDLVGLIAMSLGAAYLGARTFRNGFPKRGPTNQTDL